MKKIFCIILLIASTLCASAQVFIESKIDSIEILIGEQTGVTLSVTAKKVLKYNFQHSNRRSISPPELKFWTIPFPTRHNLTTDLSK